MMYFITEKKTTTEGRHASEISLNVSFEEFAKSPKFSE